MSFLNPFNWFKKEEESPVAPAPISTGATAPAMPGPYTSAAGRRRRHRRKGGQAPAAATMKAGRRHRRKHSRRA